MNTGIEKIIEAQSTVCKTHSPGRNLSDRLQTYAKIAQEKEAKNQSDEYVECLALLGAICTHEIERILLTPKST